MHPQVSRRVAAVRAAAGAGVRQLRAGGRVISIVVRRGAGWAGDRAGQAVRHRPTAWLTQSTQTWWERRQERAVVKRAVRAVARQNALLRKEKLRAEATLAREAARAGTVVNALGARIASE